MDAIRTPLIVTLAGRRYAVERNWAQEPAKLAKAMVSQVAVDSAGRVHMFRRGDPPVLVFEPDGSFAYAYGEGRIADAHGSISTGTTASFLPTETPTRSLSARRLARNCCDWEIGTRRNGNDRSITPPILRSPRTGRSMSQMAMATRAFTASLPMGNICAAGEK